MSDNHQVTEEPCELKGSSTVLESSGSREGVTDFTRSCHDAIEQIFTVISQKAKYVLDADIAKCFDHIDHEALLNKLNTFPTIRRHPQKSIQWIIKRYWKTVGDNNWVFATSAEGENLMRLRTHSETPTVRHVKVKGESSPYDANLVYWSTRMGKNPQISTKEATLLKIQRGKCNHCELYFRDGDIWEIDHNIPRSNGGKDEYSNLQLLHKHCHDVKTAGDGAAGGSIVNYPGH